ncbi:MAG: glycerol-3-phosphate acyltransferase [Anaerolineales bacterium]|nr:glycerol-3-phosphate acyltransferase [Anaerolineales bacterium]
MTVLWIGLASVIGYLLGSIPFGYIFVRLFTGQDVRAVGSGRTGSTNVMRAGGGKVALLTGVCDALKAAGAVWLAQWLVPQTPWAEVGAGLAAILGHNYSLFLGFKGGAGGAPTVGATAGIWFGSLGLVVPVGALIWYFVGYASLTTISFAVTAICIMLARWLLGAGPAEHIVFAVLALALCLWSLRPNLKRLREGTERRHGWHARKAKPQT